MKTTLIAATLTLGLLTTTAASADGIYYGFGLGLTSAESEQGGGGVGFSEIDTPMLGVTTGYKWNVNSGFAGLEMDADLSFGSSLENTISGATCSSAAGATGAYFCSHDATVRFRGVYGRDVGNGWNIFGALGYGFVSGTGATSTTTSDDAITGGITAGIGAQKQFGAGTLRIEFIHDNFSDGLKKASPGPGVSYTPTWEANTLKATYLINF